MTDIFRVEFAERLERDLRKVPKRIIRKLKLWVDHVENEGVRDARKIKSYHDEPLQGIRFGQRSIRLNRSYRALYIEKNDGYINLIEVVEVNKHEY